MRRRLRQAERKLVFNKFGGRCAYCGIVLVRGFHIDHVVPLKKGGSCDMDNLYPSCRRCNSWKKTFDLEQFREEIEAQTDRLLKRSPQYNLAFDYGLIKETQKKVTFYFEGCRNDSN